MKTTKEQAAAIKTRASAIGNGVQCVVHGIALDSVTGRCALCEARSPATALHPFCNVCGWRKGGRDSWDGDACKCGHASPPMSATDPTDAPIHESDPVHAARCRCPSCGE